VKGPAHPDEIDRDRVPTDEPACNGRAVTFAGRVARRLKATVHVPFTSETHFAGPCCYYVLDQGICRGNRREGRSPRRQGTAQAP
jgi:hypothetical protein